MTFNNHTVAAALIFAAFSDAMAQKSFKAGMWVSLAMCIDVVPGALVMLLGYAFFVGSLGGWSYGIRYLIPIMPRLLFFIPVVLKKMRIPIFICVLTLSTLFALIGMYNPWPPVYEPEIEPHPIGGNFSAWMREYFGKGDEEIAQKVGGVSATNTTKKE